MIIAFKYDRKQNKKERRFVMYKKIYFIEILVGLAIILIALSGCASSRTNLVKNEMLKVCKK